MKNRSVSFLGPRAGAVLGDASGRKARSDLSSDLPMAIWI